MTNDLLVLEKEILPSPQPRTYMLAGFHQEANAGDVSTGIPEYLIKKLNLAKIGYIRPEKFYGFPALVKYVDGHEEPITKDDISNDFYAGSNTGLVIFIGTSPIMDPDEYANAFLDATQELGVRRIISITGRWYSVPVDKERRISATYSLRHMKEELDDYALIFYPGFIRPPDFNSRIIHSAEQRNIELVRMNAHVPAHNISDEQGQIVAHPDYTAFLGILRRVKRMSGISLDLSDLEEKSNQLIDQLSSRVRQLSAANQGIRAYFDLMERNFEEPKFEETVINARLQDEINKILRRTGA